MKQLIHRLVVLCNIVPIQAMLFKNINIRTFRAHSSFKKLDYSIESLELHRQQQRKIEYLRDLADNRLAKVFPHRVVHRFMRDYNFSQTDHVESIKKEWIRFAVLSRKHGRALMFSDDVDKLWHTFLLFTCHYQIFCRDLFEKDHAILHHTPSIGNEPFCNVYCRWEEKQEFKNNYRELFDEEPSLDIWNHLKPCKTSCGKDIKETETQKSTLGSTCDASSYTSNSSENSTSSLGKVKSSSCSSCSSGANGNNSDISLGDGESPSCSGSSCTGAGSSGGGSSCGSSCGGGD